MTQVNWDEAFSAGRDYKTMNLLLLKEILNAAKIKPGAKALDIGCGTGDLARKMSVEGLDVTAVDSSSVALEKAKAVGQDQIDYRLVDITDGKQLLALGKRSFDLITAKLVIAFFEDKLAIMSNLGKLLSANGKLIIITPVRLGDAPISKRYRNISVDYKEFNGALRSGFSNVHELNSDYIDEGGKEITYLVSAPR